MSGSACLCAKHNHACYGSRNSTLFPEQRCNAVCLCMWTCTTMLQLELRNRQDTLSLCPLVHTPTTSVLGVWNSQKLYMLSQLDQLCFCLLWLCISLSPNTALFLVCIKQHNLSTIWSPLRKSSAHVSLHTMHSFSRELSDSCACLTCPQLPKLLTQSSKQLHTERRSYQSNDLHQHWSYNLQTMEILERRLAALPRSSSIV